jgi:hypothetical protein
MGELAVEKSRVGATTRDAALGSALPSAPGKRSAAASLVGGSDSDAVAEARRDLAALRDSALPVFLAALGGKDVARIEHAKQRIHSMMVAAADRVRAAKQPALADELDTLVQKATALGVFVGYESILPHVTRARAVPLVAKPAVAPAALAAEVVRHLDGLRFEAELEAAIAQLGSAADAADISEDDEDHQFSQLVKESAFPLVSLVTSNPNRESENARVESLSLRNDLTTIRTRLRAIRRDATELAARLSAAGTPGAATVAAESFEPAVGALRARFDTLGGRALAANVASAATGRAGAADQTLGMTALRLSPAAVGVLGGLFGTDATKFEAGFGIGLGVGIWDAVRDLFVGAAQMAELAASTVKQFIFTTGLGAVQSAGSSLLDFLEKVPDLPGLIGSELAAEWRASTTFGHGELIGKVVGYIAATIVLAVATGSESVQALIVSRGGEMAALALKVLLIADKAANPMTYIGPLAKLFSLPRVVRNAFMAGSDARKAATAVDDLARVAEEEARNAARLWSETAEGAKVAAALENSGLSVDLLAKLNDAQRAQLPAIQALIAKGKILEAIAAMDRMAVGVDRETIAKLEDALATAEGKTLPSTYRAPKATFPDGSNPEIVTTTAFPKLPITKLHHGTWELPSKVFEEGFDARGQNLDLYEHAINTRGSAFRGTTVERTRIHGQAGASAGAFADVGEYIYEIDDVPAWDLNTIMKDKIRKWDGSIGGNPHAEECEQTILANVPRERIRGAYPVIEDAQGHKDLGPYMPNPNYRTTAELVGAGGAK